MNSDTAYTMESYPQLRQRTAVLIKFIEGCGLRVPASSRLRQYLRQLEAACTADGITVPKRLDLATCHRALVEIDDLELIVTVLSRPPAVARWERHVQDILSGGVRRTDEMRHSRARDVQFELIIASLFRRGGYEVALDEPDVIVTSELVQFGIAAKRPRSVAKLRKNIRDAERQIRNSGLHGLLAVDLSCIISPTDVHIITDDFSAAHSLVINAANNFVGRNGHRIRSLVDTAHTFGVLVYLMMPVFDVVTPRLGYARRWTICNLCDLEDPRTKILAHAAGQLAETEGAG